MSLLPYYLFLVAGGVLLVALRDSPLASQKRGQYVAYLLTPPFLLVLVELNLGLGVNVCTGLRSLARCGSIAAGERTGARDISHISYLAGCVVD